MNATFIPDAAKMCSNPDLMNDVFIKSGGLTASSPNTIPPKISVLGYFRYFECVSIILILKTFKPCKDLVKSDFSC